MTTTTTTNVSFQPSDRVRRGLIAVLAAAALVASTGFVASRVADRDSLSAASPSHESTLDLTLLNGAIHVFTAPDLPAVAASTLDLTLLNGAIHVFTAPDLPEAVSAPLPRLTVNEPSSSACATGHTDACSFSHTWVDATSLPGLGAIFVGMRSTVKPLQGMGDMVAAMVIGG
jgi:hypothetical protein